RVRTDAPVGKHERLQANIAMGSPPGSEWKTGNDCVYDADLAAPTYLLQRGNEKDPVKDRPLSPGLPAFLLSEPLRIEPINLPVEAFSPELRPAVRKYLLNEVRTAIRNAEVERSGKKRATARSQLASLEARIAAELAKYGPASESERQRLALAAGKAEREANLKQLELEVFQAEQQLKAAQVAQKPGDAKTTQAVNAAGQKQTTAQ